MLTLLKHPENHQKIHRHRYDIDLQTTWAVLELLKTATKLFQKIALRWCKNDVKPLMFPLVNGRGVFEGRLFVST